MIKTGHTYTYAGVSARIIAVSGDCVLWTWTHPTMGVVNRHTDLRNSPPEPPHGRLAARPPSDWSIFERVYSVA